MCNVKMASLSRAGRFFGKNCPIAKDFQSGDKVELPIYSLVIENQDPVRKRSLAYAAGWDV